MLADAWKPKDEPASSDIKEKQQQARKEGEMYAQDYEQFRQRLKKRIRREMLWGLLGAVFRYRGGLARIFGLLLIASGIVCLVLVITGTFSLAEGLFGIIFSPLAGISYTRGVLKDIREEMEEEEREQHRQRTY